MLGIALRDLVKGRDGVRIEQLTLKHDAPVTSVEALEERGLAGVRKAPIVGLPSSLTEGATYVSVRVRAHDDNEEWSLTWDEIPSVDVPPTLSRISESVGGLAGLNEKVTSLWSTHPQTSNLVHAKYHFKGWGSPLLTKRSRKVEGASLTPTGTLWTVKDLPCMLALTVSIDPFEASSGMLVMAIGHSGTTGLVDMADLEARLWTDLSRLVSQR